MNLAAALLLLGGQAAAAPPQDVCVVPLTLWSGTLADTRSIATVPVPDSYRRAFGDRPCNTLHKPSLIDWHLAFGTEASVTAALAWLETELTRDAPAPATFLATADTAWRAVRPRLAELEALRRQPNALDRARASDPAVRRLQPLVRSYRAATLLAQQYLRAAEFHRSPLLLAKARPYLAIASEGVRLFFDDALFAGQREAVGASAVGLFSGDVDAIRDMEARAALLQAALTGSAADRAAATRLLDRGDPGLLRRAAEEAYAHGDSPCEVGDREDLAAIKTACDTENDFEGRLLAHWVVRARLAVRTPGEEQGMGAVALAEKLLRHRLLDPSQGWSVRYGSYADALADLYLWQADRAAADQGDGALRLLTQAERLTPAATNPARFLQIAEHFAALWRRLEAAPDPRDRPSDVPALAREAAFLARTRAALPAIAVGQP